MNKVVIPVQLLIVFMCLSLLLFLVRIESDNVRMGSDSFHAWSKDTHLTFEKVIAGAIPGFIADFRVLDVFAIYYEGKKTKRANNLENIAPYLIRAQNLDPKFFDVYRLASSLLVYDAHMPRAGVELLQKATYELPEFWEFPFFAGFIAHDVMKDDKLAFEMMSQVATRENTPVMVITLASRFLESSSTIDDAILFLRGLLSLLPSDQRDGVALRIKELEDDREKAHKQ